MPRIDVITPPQAVFLLVLLLHKMDVVNWKGLGLNIKKLNEYAEKYSDYTNG